MSEYIYHTVCRCGAPLELPSGHVETTCPKCGAKIIAEVSPSGTNIQWI